LLNHVWLLLLCILCFFIIYVEQQNLIRNFIVHYHYRLYVFIVDYIWSWCADKLSYVFHNKYQYSDSSLLNIWFDAYKQWMWDCYILIFHSWFLQNNNIRSDFHKLHACILRSCAIEFKYSIRLQSFHHLQYFESFLMWYSLQFLDQMISLSVIKLSCLICFTHYIICKVCILTITAFWHHVIAWLLFSACEQWAFMLSCQMISFTEQASWWFIAFILQMFECLTSLTLITWSILSIFDYLIC